VVGMSRFERVMQMWGEVDQVVHGVDMRDGHFVFR
jgi:hypothetical protein